MEIRQIQNWEDVMSTSAQGWADAAHALEPSHTIEAWKPEFDGDSTAGIVKVIDRAAGKDGTSTLVSFEDEDGKPFCLWLSTVLKQEFDRLGVTVGDVVGIKFHGWKQSKSGRDYKHYTVGILEPHVPAKIGTDKELFKSDE